MFTFLSKRKKKEKKKKKEPNLEYCIENILSWSMNEG